MVLYLRTKHARCVRNTLGLILYFYNININSRYWYYE